MVQDLQAAVPAKGYKLVPRSRIPTLQRPDRRLLVDLLQDIVHPRITFKKTDALKARRFPPWPPLDPYYLGPLLSSFSLGPHQLSFKLSNSHEFTVSIPPAPSKLAQQLSPFITPEFSYPSTNVLQGLTIPRVYRLLQVFTLVFDEMSNQHPDFFRAPYVRSDNTIEAAYSLNLIAALVGRFMGHIFSSWPHMVAQIHQYRMELISRLRLKFGTNPGLEAALFRAGLYEEIGSQPWDEWFAIAEKHEPDYNGDVEDLPVTAPSEQSEESASDLQAQMSQQE